MELKVVCQQCNARFSVSHGERSDINQNLQCQKHKEAEKAVASAGNIGSTSLHTVMVVKAVKLHQLKLS